MKKAQKSMDHTIIIIYIIKMIQHFQNIKWIINFILINIFVFK
jgi:hypothetical protein